MGDYSKKKNQKKIILSFKKKLNQAQQLSTHLLTISHLQINAFAYHKFH